MTYIWIILLLCCAASQAAPFPATRIDGCDVLVDDEPASHIPAWNQQVLYHQLVVPADVYEVPITFLIGKADAGYYFIIEDTISQKYTCLSDIPCQLNKTFIIPNFNTQDTINELNVPKLSVKHGGREICVLNLQCREAEIDIEFNLAWTGKSSLYVNVTAGFPKPSEYFLECEGQQMNATFLANEFEVSGEELRFMNCQVTAKSYLSMGTKVVPASPFTTTTTTSTTATGIVTSAATTQAFSSQTLVIILAVVVTILVIVIIVLIGYIIVGRKRKNSYQPDVTPPIVTINNNINTSSPVTTPDADVVTESPAHSPNQSDESLTDDMSSSGLGDEIDGVAAATSLTTDDSGSHSPGNSVTQTPIAETDPAFAYSLESSSDAHVTSPSDSGKVGELNEQLP